MAQFVGRVIGTKMPKTAKVSIIRMYLNPYVLKFVKKKKTFFAHDENSDCRDGDLVMIKECQKMSPKKSFSVTEILERSQSYTNPVTGKTFHQQNMPINLHFVLKYGFVGTCPGIEPVTGKVTGSIPGQVPTKPILFLFLFLFFFIHSA